MTHPTPQQPAEDATEIRQIFERMQKASRRDGIPPAKHRIALLKALQKGLEKHGKALVGSVFRDFGGRSPREILLTEILPLGGSLSYTIKQLPRWLRPERRAVNWTFLPSKAQILYQPKGVVLVIAPWNYPLLLSLEPLIGALAAGNRVIIKPSELAPATAKALKTMISDIFAPDQVQVINGDAAVAAQLTHLPFDHILFTGSTKIGKQVMKAAAENLCPVTLELGGKSPTLIHESFDLKTAARRIAFGKLLNAGQTCIAPDYVMVPRRAVEAFTDAYHMAVAEFYPKLVSNVDYSTIINQQHYQRLLTLIEDAKAKGAEIFCLDPAGEGAVNEKRKKIAPHLLLNVNEDMKIMQEEIFGPLLPVLPYDTLKQAIEAINARPRPLALYYFDNDRKRIRYVMEHTIAGGVTINDTIFHIAQHDLPFGGIGPSGIGSYHAIEGFKTFSHGKPVYYQSRLRAMDRLMPPWGARFDRIMKLLMGKF